MQQEQTLATSAGAQSDVTSCAHITCKLTDANARAEKHRKPRRVVERRLLVVLAELKVAETGKRHVYHEDSPHVLRKKTDVSEFG